jgi:membrane-bound ClpP family serine protease
MKRRRLLAMKRANRTVARSRPLQGKIRTDQIHDIGGFADTLNGFFRDKSHASKLPCRDTEREGDFTAMQRWLLLLFFFSFLPTARPAEKPIRTGSVVVLPIRSSIDDAQFYFVRRALKNAENVAAAAVILDLDTAEGDAMAATKIQRILLKSPVPAYVYAKTKSETAGSLIALGTGKVFTAPSLMSGAPAVDVADLANQCGLDVAKIVYFQPSRWEATARWLLALTPFLLMGGFTGAYLGFHSPRFGTVGSISGLCFLLFFASHYIAGLTSLEMPVLFGLGIIFILMESFLFRGVVVLALGGMALVFAGIFFSMVDFYPAQPVNLSWEKFSQPFFNIALAWIGSVFTVFLIKRLFSKPPEVRDQKGKVS